MRFCLRGHKLSYSAELETDTCSHSMQLRDACSEQPLIPYAGNSRPRNYSQLMHKVTQPIRNTVSDILMQHCQACLLEHK